LLKLYFQEKQYTEDQIVTAKVKGALLADSELKNADLSVATYLHEVELSGTVQGPARARRVEQIARDIEGVEAVQNEIQVRRSTSK
jgi:hyperosmotically inducible protein